MLCFIAMQREIQNYLGKKKKKKKCASFKWSVLCFNCGTVWEFSKEGVSENGTS